MKISFSWMLLLSYSSISFNFLETVWIKKISDLQSLTLLPAACKSGHLVISAGGALDGETVWKNSLQKTYFVSWGEPNKSVGVHPAYFSGPTPAIVYFVCDSLLPIWDALLCTFIQILELEVSSTRTRLPHSGLVLIMICVF